MRTRVQINLPCVESVHDFGIERDDGEAYIASECIPGASLADLTVALEQVRKPLPWSLALALFHQARSLLRQVHEKAGVSHGLRPANIRLETTGALKLCWGLNLADPTSSAVADEVELARCVFALAGRDRPGAVERILAGGDPASLSVLGDLIAETEPALANAAALVLWSDRRQEATQVLAERLKQADVTWLWHCLAPFFPPFGLHDD